MAEEAGFGSRYEEQELEDEDDDSGSRTVWRVLSWIVVAFTILLNLALIAIILVRRNAYNIVNKTILTVAIVDLFYGVFVSPFFVENYVDLHWNQSQTYCEFFEYFFTFHDLFVPIVLILISTYVSLKYSGASETFEYKRPVILACVIVALVLSLLLAIPATEYSAIFIDDPPGPKYTQECRTLDTYTMVLTYCLSSSILFCFTMSFLFSLCIVGSPLLRTVIDREIYVQRWRFLLSISLVNGLYIVTGFLLNFKEISRIFYNCCAFEEPFLSLNTLTYDIWSFVLLISEPFLRPLVYFCFYFRYVYNDYSM